MLKRRLAEVNPPKEQLTSRAATPPLFFRPGARRERSYLPAQRALARKRSEDRYSGLMGKGGGDCSERVALLLEPENGSPLRADERPIDYNSHRLNFEYLTEQRGVQECLRALQHPQVQVVALDIETTGSSRPWNGTIRLIQVAVEEPEPRQFLIDCWETEPDLIFPVLANQETEITTCNGVYEQDHLLYRYGVRIGNFYDVCVASRLITAQKQEPTKQRALALVEDARLRYQERIEAALAQQALLTEPEEIKLSKAQVNGLKAAQKAAMAEAKARAPKPRKIKNDFEALSRRYTNRKISKKQQSSGWDQLRLSYAQRRYAANDVAGLLDIHRQIKLDVAARGLEQEVAEGCARVWEKSSKTQQVSARSRHQQAERLVRAFTHARDLEELQRFRALQGRMTLQHSMRLRVDAAYNARLEELVMGEPASLRTRASE